MSFIPVMEPSIRRLCVRLFLISLAVHILSAWFNVGFHQLDEHFQIVEFASYKRDVTPANVLPWEFAARIRPAMQPAIAYAVMELMDGMGVFNPFGTMFVMRLISALLGWMTALLLTLYAVRWLTHERSQQLLIWLSALFWCAPYLHSRFSSESWSAMSLFLGALVILHGMELVVNLHSKRWWLFMAGGVLLGFSFEMRFQTAIAIAGFIVWISIYKQCWREGIMILVGIATMVGVGATVDAWFYGTWVFPPWNYFHVNLVQGMAATFGVEPWWWYFKVAAIWLAIPPLGAIAIVMIGMACVWYWRNPFVWLSVPFVAIHCLIAHKEERFMFPIIFAVPVFLTLAIEFIVSKNGSRWAHGLQALMQKRWLAMLLIVSNCVALAVMTLKPASMQPIIYKYCYDLAAASSQQVEIYTLDNSPFRFLNVEGTAYTMEILFYQPQNFRVRCVTESEFMAALAALKTNDKPLLFFHKKTPPPFLSDPTIAKTVAVSSFPEWITYFNVNAWVARTNIWTIYECKLQL